MIDFITKEGLKKMQEELQNLKEVRRREVAERLRAAAAMGDLSENFDYQNAKEEQEFIERRISELEYTISNSKLVQEGSGKAGVVQIGSKVTVEADGESFEVKITGPQEADPLQGKLSVTSPLGEALLGKKEGQKTVVETPGGMVTYKIVKVQ